MASTMANASHILGKSSMPRPVLTADKPQAQPAPQAQQNTKSGNRKAATITPPKAAFTDLDRRMSVEKGVVDELLLICGVIGTSTNDGEELIPVTDCLNWLQDLQRALRRDDDLYRPISLLIGKWRVVQQKLLPLIMTCRYDSAIVLTVVKILVILTKPLAENTKRAGRVIIDTKKTNDLVIKEQIRLRDNAIEQAELLMEYKRAIVHHPSHHYSKKDDTDSSKEGTGLLSVLVSLLAEPLSKSGTARTEADHLTIELVLHLVRNFLSAEPLLKTSGDTSRQHAQLHQELITLFDRELVLEIVLVIGQDMDRRENSQYNLLVMELLHHLLKSQDPTAVAKPATKDKAGSISSSLSRKLFPSPSDAANPTVPRRGLLAERLQQEKSKIAALAGPRHGHFGGTFKTQRLDGKRAYSGTTQEMEKLRMGGGAHENRSLVAKRKNRKAEPFIGATNKASVLFEEGPATKRAQQTLNKFCHRFIQDCYGPVMKSLKGEFRRESARLEETDLVVFFRIVWFFSQWYRIHCKTNKATDSENVLPTSKLIFTMDIFMFNLVLNATESYTTHKQYARLAQTVALYSEMMHLLNEMYNSKESTEQVMAMGLMDRLFYGSEPLDKLPKLISKWIPGTTTREYVCDLCEISHVTLKLLESAKKGCQDVEKSKEKDKSMDTVTKMKAAAASFDFSGYFLKKIVSNQLVFMYTHLLSQYSFNSAQVNHHIVAMFLRMSRTTIISADEDDSDDLQQKNLLATKVVTLEPMLYNIQLFLVVERILNDPAIRKEKANASLLSFCASLMTKFADAAAQNPMLYVECLFRHIPPQKFCDVSTNFYVNEELRMIVELQMRLEEQRRSGEEQDNDDADYSDNDEELEFVDDEEEMADTGPESRAPWGKKRKKHDSNKRRRKLAKRIESDDDDEKEFEDVDKAASQSIQNDVESSGQAVASPKKADTNIDSDSENSTKSDKGKLASTESTSSEHEKENEADGDNDDDDDDSANKSTSGGPSQEVVSKEAEEEPKARKRPKILSKNLSGDISSDDEIEFDGGGDDDEDEDDSGSSKMTGDATKDTTAGSKPKKASSRFVIDDDDDDD